MAANPPLNITAAPATFQAAYAQLAEMHFNRDPAIGAADARERVVAEWGDWQDGALFAFQALLFDYPGTSEFFLRNGSVAMTGNIDLDENDLVAVNLLNGRDADLIPVGPATAISGSIAFYTTTNGQTLSHTNYVIGDVFLRDGSVVATGNFDLDGNDLVDVNLLNGRDADFFTIAPGGVAAGSVTFYPSGSGQTLSNTNFLIQDIVLIQGNGSSSISGDATPDVDEKRLLSISGSTTITDFDSGTTGQELIILAVSSFQVSHGTGIKLDGSANFGMTAGDNLSLIYDGTQWQETGRKVA